jgi:zinc protease
VSARIAANVLSAGGVGQFSSVMLDKLLAGKAVAVSPFIGEIEQGLGGGSTPQDLETMFQLIYLRFTQPRADPTAFAALASQARGLLANRAASPDVVFNQTIDAALSRNSPRRQPETAATVDQWNLARSMAFYKARFADADNFTFVFVGSFTPDTIKPFVETYIASLPATHAGEKWRDLGITAPSGVIDKTIEMGIAPKAQVAIVFSGPFDYDDAHILSLRTMTLLLQSRLLDTIRQELGGTYSITATPDADKYPKPEYSVRIEWTCDPARTAPLVQRVFEEVENLKNTYISREWAGRIREALLREYDQNSQDNGFVLSQIVRHYADGVAPDAPAIGNFPDQVAALTGDQIQQAARTYLSSNNYVKVTLMPAK